MEKEDSKKEQPRQNITFHYIKSEGFKTILATGAIGGVTINSLVNMNLYTDRVVIPSEMTLEVDEFGRLLQKELDVKAKKGVVRDVQCSVLMDVAVAKSLVEWLNRQIQLIESNKQK